MQINDNFCKLPGSYLFSEIARRVAGYTGEHPEAALIRLGITDTATIAALLHCSVNTVYSYRSRMRLRSLVPERDFEQRVQSIGLWDDAAELSGT